MLCQNLHCSFSKFLFPFEISLCFSPYLFHTSPGGVFKLALLLELEESTTAGIAIFICTTYHRSKICLAAQSPKSKMTQWGKSPCAYQLTGFVNVPHTCVWCCKISINGVNFHHFFVLLCLCPHAQMLKREECIMAQMQMSCLVCLQVVSWHKYKRTKLPVATCILSLLPLPQFTTDYCPSPHDITEMEGVSRPL